MHRVLLLLVLCPLLFHINTNKDVLNLPSFARGKFTSRHDFKTVIFLSEYGTYQGKCNLTRYAILFLQLISR